MVAKITTSTSIGNTLRYNEQKVQKGVATCLYAGNFLKDVEALHFREKLARFKALHALNTRAKTNTLHISLNFHPSEQLSRERLVEIAAAYQQKIGFSEQPYLVYEHRDAGHPHIHIVTTTIQANGKRISTHNIGINQSRNAQKEIEEAFGLMKAGSVKQQPNETEERLGNQKIRYGRIDTKRAMTAVLSNVIHGYHYASLAELNAVLQLFNLVADPGKAGGPIHRHGGLLYQVLDEMGRPVGVPIKASSFSFRPTLPYLEKAFQKGALAKEPHKKKLKAAIDFSLLQKPDDPDHLARLLYNEKITLVLRKDVQDDLYDLTYVDHRTKSVFNGSDLGTAYSAAGIQKRIAAGLRETESKEAMLLERPSAAAALPDQKSSEKRPLEELLQKPEKARESPGQRLADSLHQLLKTERKLADLPNEFRKKQGGGPHR